MLAGRERSNCRGASALDRTSQPVDPDTRGSQPLHAESRSSRLPDNSQTIQPVLSSTLARLMLAMTRGRAQGGR